MIGALASTRPDAPESDRMNARYIDWIWNIRGHLALAPELTADDAFDRLDPLFRETGTRSERANETLVFQKKDQAAQDKMSIFDGGVLHVEDDGAGPVLRYRLTSRALLFCFLAPLLFLAIGQLTIVAGRFQKSSTEAAGKTSDAKQKKAEVAMNPIDKALGAPAPEKPKKDGEKKAEGRNKKPSPTTAYVFAGIFAALYIVGRILEDYLVKGLFRRRLFAA